MEDKSVLEANEAIKKIKSQNDLEKDVIWGYLEDFKTINKVIQDRYMSDPYGRAYSRKFLCKNILTALEMLLNTYNCKED